MSASLTVSVVTYAPEFVVLVETLGSLARALDRAYAEECLGQSRVTVIDNGPGTRFAEPLRQLVHAALPAPFEAEVLSGHGNVGYGRGHNLALLVSDADYHLVLNPDVTLAPEAIVAALSYMKRNAEIVILAPEASDERGEPLYLCKRYPSVLDLTLRGFAPRAVRRLLRARLDHYEMRDLPRSEAKRGVPILSGSFMFCRRGPIAAIGGFSDAFFVYFEDFDLSLRAAAVGGLAYVPTVRIVHRGGHAARKGLCHVALFARSALTFFNRHGWKWV